MFKDDGRLYSGSISGEQSIASTITIFFFCFTELTRHVSAGGELKKLFEDFDFQTAFKGGDFDDTVDMDLRNFFSWGLSKNTGDRGDIGDIGDFGVL